MIREATEDDAEWLLELTTRFNDRYYHTPLNRNKAFQTIHDLILHPASVILVSGGGYIAGMVEDDPFRDYTFLVEKGWFAEDRSGLKLLDAFIEVGRDNPHINEVRLCHLNSNPSVQKLLLRRGFEIREVSCGLAV